MKQNIAFFLKVLFTTYLLNFNLKLLALPQQIEELKYSLDTAKSAKVKASILNELAWQSRNIDPQASNEYAQEAFSISKEYGLLKESTYSLNRLASYQMSQGNFVLAKKFYEESISIRLNIGDSLLIGGAYTNLGNLYRLQGDQLNAFKQYGLARNFLQVKNGQRDLAKVLTSVGLLYQKSGDYFSAIEKYEKALSIRQKNKLSKDLADSYLVLAGIHQELKRYALAKEYYLKAEISYGEENFLGTAKVWNNLGNTYYLNNQLDSAMLYYSKSLDAWQALNNVYETARTLNNIGQVYANQENEQMVEYYTLLALEEWKSINAQQGIAESLLNLGLSYSKSEIKKDTAMRLLEESYNISHQFGFPVLELKALKILASLEEKKNGINRAFPYLKECLKLNDSLNYNYKQSVNLQFQLEQERRKRVEETFANELLITENKRQNTLIISGSIIFLLLLAISGTLVVIFRQKKKKAELEKERKEQELLSVQSILETQDLERKRIARDLHDRLGSMLSWVKLTFQSSEDKIEQLKTDNQNAYQNAIKKLDEAVELTREIAQNLDSGVLNKFGLVPAVKELIQSIEKSIGLNIEFEYSALKDRLEKSTEEALYRIIQELLNNVLKHAQAKEVTIQITRNNGNLNLIVEDDGKGFDVNKLLENRSGLGVKNIQSRLVPLDGKVEFDSVKGRGTIVIIDLPIKPIEHD